jgi:hypothetical protein
MRLLRATKRSTTGAKDSARQHLPGCTEATKPPAAGAGGDVSFLDYVFVHGSSGATVALPADQPAISGPRRRPGKRQQGCDLAAGPQNSAFRRKDTLLLRGPIR